MCYPYKSIKTTLIFLLYCLITTSSCKKLVEIEDPANSIVDINVYKDDATAIATLNVLYIDRFPFVASSGGITFSGGLSSDELSLQITNAAESDLAFYTNSLKSDFSGTIGTTQWSGLYGAIFRCNTAIEGLENANSLTSRIRKQLTGEARFMRAFFYFYLVNLYGDVPLALTSDYKMNSLLSRRTALEVYQQIILDLKIASELLSETYLDGNLQEYVGPPERLRPTKWAALAMLARVYLYTNDYVNAELSASEIISNSSLFSLTPLSETFLANNSEAVWQLESSTTSGYNTGDARLFILPPTGPANPSFPVFLSANLLESFENGDQRRINWIDSVVADGSIYYYPFKYKSATFRAPVTEHLTVFRVAEQYLIRSEARAQQANLPGALEDLNTVRNRAGLSNMSGPNQSEIVNGILHERQVEFFTEFGQRWFDLKRSGKINEVMSVATPLKGGTWETTDQLYPIPFEDIQKDPNLVQNPGYN